MKFTVGFESGSSVEVGRLSAIIQLCQERSAIDIVDIDERLVAIGAEWILECLTTFFLDNESEIGDRAMDDIKVSLSHMQKSLARIQSIFEKKQR